jgi:hypothetical protein
MQGPMSAGAARCYNFSQPLHRHDAAKHQAWLVAQRAKHFWTTFASA